MSTERRQPRRPLDVAVRGREGTAAGKLLFDTKDVSAGGAFLKSDLLYEEGERLSLELSLPGRAAPVQVRARVVWVQRFPSEGEDAGMGVEFEDLAEADRKALLDLGEA
jgi:uncharacterized protein (TIGR02266 family)